MKHVLALPIALTASGALLAADPLPHGASTVISGITCKTLDLTPNDGVAPYATLIPTRTSYGPYSVGGSLEGSGGKSVEKFRSGAGLESLYLTLDREGSSGTAILAPSGNGTVGLLSASSATAPGRVFDSYGFVASYYPQFGIGPNSAIECKAQYVITAWAKPSIDAPDNAASEAKIAIFDLATGEGGTFAKVRAEGNPSKGNRYGQKAGQATLRLYNYGEKERGVVGAFQALVSGGHP